MKALMKMKKGPGGLELADRPVPLIGDDDLLLEVKAAGICGSDIRIKNLGDSENLRPPVILGHEFAGIVAETGKNVTAFQVGDRVVSDNSGALCGQCEECAKGNYMMCKNRVGLGIGMDGGFASYVKISGRLLSVNPHTLYRIPDSVSFAEASVMDPLCNAYKAVVQESSLMPGQDILIFGLGTIGLLAVEVANCMGAANIIAVNRSCNQKKFEIAQELGATCTLCSEEEDVVQWVKTLTGGEMAPVIIDCAGANEVLQKAPELLKKGGEVVKVGYDQKPVDFSLDAYVRKGIRIQGHFAYDHVSWVNCLKLLEKGKLAVKPVITHELPLTEWEKAFTLLEKGEGIKIVLIP